jgi:hypothetical protein
MSQHHRQLVALVEWGVFPCTGPYRSGPQKLAKPSDQMTGRPTRWSVRFLRMSPQRFGLRTRPRTSLRKRAALCELRNDLLGGQRDWSGDAIAAIVAEILKRHSMRNVKDYQAFLVRVEFLTRRHPRKRQGE